MSENDAPENGDNGAPENNGNREAAKWRKALRAVEAERDSLAERVKTYHTREVQRIASQSLASPDDLFTLGHSLEEFIDAESGDVNADAVNEAVSTLLASRPGLAVQHAPNHNGGALPPPQTRAVGWADVLNPRSHSTSRPNGEMA